MPKILISDIDNTVADQIKRLKETKKNLSHDEFLKIAYSNNEIIKYEVLENANEGINLFKKNNYRIIWLTARKKFMKETTLKWLKKHNFPVDELIVVDKISSKLKQINKINPDIIIDDCNYNQHNLKPLPATDFINIVKKNHNLIIFKNNWNWIIKNFDKIKYKKF